MCTRTVVCYCHVRRVLRQQGIQAGTRSRTKSAPAGPASTAAAAVERERGKRKEGSEAERVREIKDDTIEVIERSETQRHSRGDDQKETAR